MTLGSDSTASPLTIGAFRVVRRLGSGGSSTVYLAERTSSFAQRVAIKLLSGAHGAGALESEQRLLSSLEHGNIVRLLDQGVSDAGQRYLVMEFVDGLPIDQFCDARRLPIAARIQLLIEAMAGVSYAHRHMVVHADLKPWNILVDAAGEPKLLDFGIAAMLGSEAKERDEAPLFTPDFASPEQKLGAPVSVASDVYSLGVVATLLIAGVRAAPQSASPATERLRRLDRKRLDEIAEARSTNRAALLRTVAGDLEAILAKALEDAPAERYGTVAAFADDLSNYLGGWPISAVPATRSVRMRKWVRRHLLLSSLSAVSLLAIGFSAAGVTLQTARAAHQRRLTQTQLQDLVRLTGELDGELFDSARPLAGSEAARRTLLEGATKTLDRLAAEDGGDPQVAIGVARQYERLARSWLTLGNAGGQASADIARALALLDRLPPEVRRSAAVTQQRSELVRMQASVQP